MSDLWVCVWRQLWRRKSRTFIYILSYVLAISVMLVLLTWFSFSRRAADEVLNNTGTHFIVFAVDMWCCPISIQAVPSKNEGFLAMGLASKPIPASYVESVKKIPGVKDASACFLYRFKDDSDGHLFTVGGFDLESPVSIGSTSCAPNDMVSGRFLTAQDRAAVMIEDAYAKAMGLKVGDDIKLTGRNFKIIGIVSPGIRPAKADIYMRIAEAQDIINTRLSSPIKYKESINVILVEARSAIMQDEAIKAVKSIDPQLIISSYACYKPAASVMGMNDKTAALVLLIIALGVLVFSAVLQYASVIERQRDIAILKAIGWSNKEVVTQVLAESVLQSLIGGVIGCILAALIIYFVPIKELSGLKTSLALMVSPRMVVFLLGLSLGGGIIAGILPAFKISSQNPADTLKAI